MFNQPKDRKEKVKLIKGLLSGERSVSELVMGAPIVLYLRDKDNLPEGTYLDAEGNEWTEQDRIDAHNDPFRRACFIVLHHVDKTELQ